MRGRLRVVATVCAGLWLLPVVGFFGYMVTVWFIDPPEGYEPSQDHLVVLAATLLGLVVTTTLASLAFRPRGGGGWLLGIGVFGVLASCLALLPVVVSSLSAGPPGAEPSDPPWGLIGGLGALLALSVVTIAAASRLMRAERPLVPPQGHPPAWPPAAPGR